ncbi:MAG: hypothetical protein IH891_00860 [Planctomycetes bacterium]|nr:hypothetical protein [Planctomycetota bacterium]
MPRMARFIIAAIEDLYRQLQYAPAETRIKQMNAAEQLVEDIDPVRNYPEDFIIFRVTGYRPRFKDDAMLVGEALLPDLINLVQHLSDSLELPCDFNGRQPTLLTDAALRLNISTKTIQRYRKRGLVCHYVIFPDQVKRLVCFEDAINRFVIRNRQQLHRASHFSRVEETVAQKIITEATTLSKKKALSLNEVALRLAKKYARAHETVRLILKRHDRLAPKPIFNERGPLTQRDIRLIFRAWCFGIPVAVLARRFGKGGPAIHRAINRRRRELLLGLDLSYIELPTFALDDAESVILAAPNVVSNLDDVIVGDEVLTMIAQAHRAGIPDETVEDSLIAGYNFLKRRVSERVSTLPESPNSRLLDLIETDLRWAAMLKCRLVSLALPTVLKVIEQTLHRKLIQLPADEIIHLLNLGSEVASRAIESLNPSERGQRLERVCNQAMGRAMAALYVDTPLGRAAARHEPGSIVMPSIYVNCSPWQSWLNPKQSYHGQLESLNKDDVKLIRLRYGLDGGRPHALGELSELAGMSIQRVTRRIQRLERRLRNASRESVDGKIGRAQGSTNLD